MSVEVREVESRRDRRAFVELPFRLHSNHEQWVPPLKLERHHFLHPRTGGFYRHGEAALFLARRDGRVAGRISAQIDRRFNEHHGARTGNFGFLEFVDDPEVLRALLEAAEGWLRGRGMDRMVGPMDFTQNDEIGVLFEGYELAPMIRQPWQPPYYAQRCEEVGLRKEIDLYMWSLDVKDRENMLPIMFELADKARDEHGVTIRRMSRRTLRKDLDVFAEIYNRAWRRNWGFVPFTPADLDAYAQELQLVFDKRWFMIAEIDGEAVGAAITVPDVNQALRRMDGRLLPLGWWHFLRKGSYIDWVRVGFLGVKPEHQHTGVAALLYVEHFDTAAAHPILKGGETGWILETNTNMNRGMEAMNGRIVKKYRVYERPLDPR